MYKEVSNSFIIVSYDNKHIYTVYINNEIMNRKKTSTAQWACKSPDTKLYTESSLSKISHKKQ
jgi:hypothetical protein